MELALAMTLLVILSVASVTVLSIVREQTRFEDELRKEAELLLNTLAISTIRPLYLLSVDELRDVMAELGTAGVVAAGHIYDADGRVIADANDRDAPYRLAADPLGRQLTQSAETRLIWESGRLVAGRAVIAGRQTLGAISVTLSTAPLANKTADAAYQGLLAALGVAVVAAVMATLMSRTVTRSLRQLSGAARRIAAGSLSQRVPLGGGSEVTTLAQSFNEMADSLGRTLVSKHYVDRIISSMVDSLLVTSAQGTIQTVNAAACGLLGYQEGELVGAGADSIFEADWFTAELLPKLRASADRVIEAEEACLRTADGRLVPVGVSASTMPADDSFGERIVCMAVDIRERRAAEATIKHMAYHDSLTGLPNRAALVGIVETALAEARTTGRSVGILFLDLDRFKLVNDSLGHISGDALLCEVVEVLRRPLREGDSLVRLGGDEFIIVLPGIERIKQVSEVAERLRACVAAQSFELGEFQLYVTASVGISLFPRDGEEVETLVKAADAALYEAKDAGRDRIATYHRELSSRAMQRISVAGDLRRAVDREEFVLHYQPIIDVDTGETVAAEALLRWARPPRGLVAPSEFLPVAAESGLIVHIGAWTLHAACRQAAAWNATRRDPLPVAVNVAVQQLAHSGFLDLVSDALATSRLGPKLLVLEVSEGALMSEIEGAPRVLRELRALGVGLAIDDFGKEYSSLSQLTHVPMDTLKIDRTFVRGVGQGTPDEAIVAAVVFLARRLGVTVVAEGVETEEQLTFLREAGCDAVQGFLISKPLPADEFAPFAAAAWQGLASAPR